MKTQKGSIIYQLLSGRNNVHLIQSGSDWILVDTGMRRFYPTLKKKLEKRLPKGARLTLFLTHTHYDHCQNARALKEDFNCKILSSQKEADFSKIGRSPLPKGINVIARFMVFLGETIGRYKTSFPTFNVDETIKDDISYSTSIKIIQTPGHTLGSQSLIVDDELAFVGDAMFGIFKNSIYPPFADDVPEMIRSWEKLLNSDCEYFFPGHGRKINSTFLKKQKMRYSE